MFIMVMFTGILAAMLFWYNVPPQISSNIYDAPSPAQNPQAARAEAFGANMVTYHKAAVAYMVAHPSYSGVIPNDDIMGSAMAKGYVPANYVRVANWTSLAADIPAPFSGKGVFTYPTETLIGVPPGMMISGMARANGFGWGTGLAKNGRLQDAMPQTVNINAVSAWGEAVTYGTLWTRKVGNNTTTIPLPTTIPNDTAVQMTLLR